MLFDDQAERFDERAALPAPAARRIADVLRDMVSLRPGQRWLELGPGTGALSLDLVRSRIAYVGVDSSEAMLSVFRDKLAQEGLSAELRVADANAPWPVPDGGIDVVFSARAVHHVAVKHAVDELARVASPEGVFLVLGRVKRPPDSVRAEMRARMRELLARRGYVGLDHRGHSSRIFEALESLGVRRIEPRIAARWTQPRSPADSLVDWRGKEGLAGLTLPGAVKDEILTELRAWATEQYGDPHAPLQQEESFEVSGAFVKGVGRG